MNKARKTRLVDGIRVGMFHDLSNKAAVDSELFSNFLTRPKCRKLMPKKSRWSSSVSLSMPLSKHVLHQLSIGVCQGSTGHVTFCGRGVSWGLLPRVVRTESGCEDLGPPTARTVDGDSRSGKRFWKVWRLFGSVKVRPWSGIVGGGCSDEAVGSFAWKMRSGISINWPSATSSGPPLYTTDKYSIQSE